MPSLVRKGVWNTRKDPKCFKSKSFWTQKFLWTQNILAPKMFRIPDLLTKNFGPNLDTFTWESSVALLSPTCCHYCCFCYCYCYPKQKNSQLLVLGLRLNFDKNILTLVNRIICANISAAYQVFQQQNTVWCSSLISLTCLEYTYFILGSSSC